MAADRRRLELSLANHVPLSPLTFLARACRAFPGKIAVIDGDGTEVSYETLGRDCAAMAGALRAGGIRPGDRVAVLDLNTRWLLAAHYGVPGAGAALVALNSRLAAPEYRDILAHSRARVLLLSPALLPALGVSSAGELPVETVVLLPVGQDPPRPPDEQVVLPGATRTTLWDGSGVELKDLPPENVMDVGEMVDAALAGFDQGERVTLPALPDAGDWQRLIKAREDLQPNLSRKHSAPRYKVPLAPAV